MTGDSRTVDAASCPARRTFLADWAWASPAWRWARCSTATASPGPTAPALAPPDGRPHFAPKAKNVIWLFMIGGTSHLESFDPKPALNKYAGKTYRRDAVSEASSTRRYLKENLRELVEGTAQRSQPTSCTRCRSASASAGRAGIEVSDWWPHVGDCVDDIAVVRSMWTTDNDHGAQLQFHTGRHVLEGQFPTIGSWVHYGLGSLNDDLPAVRRPGHADRRLLRRHGRPRRELPRPRARRRPARGRPDEPAAVRRARAGRLPRGAGGASSSCSAG